MVPAKKFGVKVTQYFVGFGKTVWSTKRGDTEYGVKAIPMGGFIRMVGMLPPAKRGPDEGPQGLHRPVPQAIAERSGGGVRDDHPEDDGRLFYQKAWWKKVIIMAGGPMMNIFLAVILLGGLHAVRRQRRPADASTRSPTA